MYQTLLGGASLFQVLAKLDREYNASVRGSGCQRCGGKLHRAWYPRKPRGLPEDAGDVGQLRASFCCAGCRRRCTPFSVMFLGRRVYVGAVVLIIAALRQPTREVGLGWIERQVGADRRTVRRWLEWWRDEFSKTEAYRVLVGMLSGQPDRNALPSSVLETFLGDAAERVVGLLRAVRPLTSGSDLSRVL